MGNLPPSLSRSSIHSDQGVISAVPKEVWMTIFSFLDATTACTVERVCKQFRLYSNSDFVWEKICKTHFSIIDNFDILHKLKREEQACKWKQYYFVCGMHVYEHSIHKLKKTKIGNSVSQFFSKLVGKQPTVKVLLLGIDQSGKTWILYSLKRRKGVNIPTIGFNVEDIITSGVQFVIWDISGAAKVRPLWRHYVETTRVLMWAVDCRYPPYTESREALEEFFKQWTPHLDECVLVVVCNFANEKTTLDGVIEGLGLNSLHINYYIFQVKEQKQDSSNYEKEVLVPLDQAMDWIVESLFEIE